MKNNKKAMRNIGFGVILCGAVAVNGVFMTHVFSAGAKEMPVVPVETAAAPQIEFTAVPADASTNDVSINAVSETEAVRLAADRLLDFNQDVSGMDTRINYVEGMYSPTNTPRWDITFYNAATSAAGTGDYMYEADVDALSGELLQLNKCFGIVNPNGGGANIGSDNYNLQTGETESCPVDPGLLAAAVTDPITKDRALETAKAALTGYGADVSGDEWLVDIEDNEMDFAKAMATFDVIFTDTATLSDTEQSGYLVRVGKYDGEIKVVYSAAGKMNPSAGSYQINPVKIYKY